MYTMHKNILKTIGNQPQSDTKERYGNENASKLMMYKEACNAWHEYVLYGYRYVSEWDKTYVYRYNWLHMMCLNTCVSLLQIKVWDACTWV
jgi:hypothetical protein